MARSANEGQSVRHASELPVSIGQHVQGLARRILSQVTGALLWMPLIRSYGRGMCVIHDGRSKCHETTGDKTEAGTGKGAAVVKGGYRSAKSPVVSCVAPLRSGNGELRLKWPGRPSQTHAYRESEDKKWGHQSPPLHSTPQIEGRFSRLSRVVLSFLVLR